MSTREYYRNHYFLETTRKKDLTEAISIPLGVLSLLIGGLILIIQSATQPLNKYFILEFVLVILALVFILVSAYFLIRSYYNYSYGYAPDPVKIKNYKNGLVQYYIQLGDVQNVAEQKSEFEVLQHIDDEYAKLASHNAYNNNRKSSFIHKANGALIAALLFTLIAEGVHLAMVAGISPQPEKIEIVNRKEPKMATQEPERQNPAPQAPTKPPAVPIKPSPPPGEFYKEHVEPKRRT